MLHHKKYIKDESEEWVVCVHGAGGSSVVFYKQIQAYRKHFNLLLIDLRGHGRSAQGPELQKMDYSFGSLSLDIIEVLDHLQIKKAHFVGVSLGTIIIRELAEIRKSYVKSMVLVGAITRLNLKSRFFVKLGRWFHKVLPVMVLYRFFAIIIMPFNHHKEARNVFIREAQKVARKEFVRWFNITRKLTAKLKHMEEEDVGIPVLYIMGEQDYIFLEPIKELVKKFKNQSLHIVENCGHVVNIEKPHVFNDVSIRFMKQC